MHSSSAETPVIRRRRSRSEVLDLIRSFEQSGQSLREFCRRHGLSKSTLSNMLHRYGSSVVNSVCSTAVVDQQLSSDVATVSFAPVEIVASRSAESTERASSLVVELQHGVRVHLDRNFDEVLFARLLAVLNKA